jgi:drug/metabolite transporter (DMT)-like permease
MTISNDPMYKNLQIELSQDYLDRAATSRILGLSELVSKPYSPDDPTFPLINKLERRTQLETGEILGLLTALLWATAVLFFKRSGERVHPVALNLFKDSLAFVLFIPTALVIGQPLLHISESRDFWILALSGFLGVCVADTLYFYSLQALGAGVSSVVNCLYSPAVFFFSYFTLGERLSFLQALGVASIVLAVALATGGKAEEGHGIKRVLFGVIAGLGAVITSAAGIVLMKPVLEHSPIVWVNQVRLLFGIGGLGLLLVLHPGRREILGSLKIRAGWKDTFIGSFIGAYIALLPWTAGFKLAKASTTSALQQTSYLLVFIMAGIFLKEKMTMLKIAGITLGMAGVFLVSFY